MRTCLTVCLKLSTLSDRMFLRPTVWFWGTWLFWDKNKNLRDLSELLFLNSESRRRKKFMTKSNNLTKAVILVHKSNFSIFSWKNYLNSDGSRLFWIQTLPPLHWGRSPAAWLQGLHLFCGRGSLFLIVVAHLIAHRRPQTRLRYQTFWLPKLKRNKSTSHETVPKY